MSVLKELRKSKSLTQHKAADLTGISLRSYISYENDSSKSTLPKYSYLLRVIEQYEPYKEDRGILTISQIQNICHDVFKDYNVGFCYLFGSYAKGTPRDDSDIDLLIYTDTSGLRYYGLAEKLRESLHKKIDLLDIKQVLKNEQLLIDILKTGMKIYG